MRIPLLLDCDTGIDDALALAYLLRRPEIELVAVTTVSGNVEARTAAANTAGLLTLAGTPDVPVHVGAADPLGATYSAYVPHIHGRNGVGDVALPAGHVDDTVDGPHAIVAAAHRYPGRLRILAIGPLTNLARALEIDPSITGLVGSVTVMGGAFDVPGNVSPVAEANIWNDAAAAARVARAPWPLAAVPLDATMRQRLGVAHEARLRDSSRPVAHAVGSMLGVYLDYYEGRLGVRECAVHDPLAAAVAIDALAPSQVLRRTGMIDVDASDGPERGRTVLHPSEDGRHTVVTDVTRDFGADLVELVVGGHGTPIPHDTEETSPCAP